MIFGLGRDVVRADTDCGEQGKCAEATKIAKRVLAIREKAWRSPSITRAKSPGNLLT
jgi:hypothetical protein